MIDVLVIDDEQEIRSLCQTALEHSGFKVVVAENGKNGIKVFIEVPAKIVLTDIFMPEQDGIETVMYFRNNYPEVKLIVISGGSSKYGFSCLNIAGKLGADYVFEKPFKIEELIKTVKCLLSEDI